MNVDLLIVYNSVDHLLITCSPVHSVDHLKDPLSLVDHRLVAGGGQMFACTARAVQLQR